jgi:glycosyltransferase involved in cell wall biosynthesis
LACPSGGLPEVVVDGKTGVLVEPANAGALSAALVRLLDDPQLRARLGAAGRSDVGRFSLERYAGRLTEIYRRLAAERARRRAHAGEALSEPSTAR